ncbi:MAG: DEAD/DEAH box helicase [Bacteroidales bacterium]|nr:DEAD/DEAH box helicase [Bacteroidales bacterium]
METDSNFKKLDPRLQRWAWAQGWQALKPIQENAIEPILSADTDVVISAATAGGKTEAAFLPMLTHVMQSPPAEGFSVLALSPLKALINDQARRIEDMTRDLEIDVTPWHGDASQSKKSAARRRPSGVLLTTPESLEAMLSLHAPWVRQAFANLQYVLVDELHSFIGSERGAQLMSLLSRIESAIGRKVPRIALSATISDPETARRWLRPHQDMPCAFPDSGGEMHQVQIAVKEFVADATHHPEEAISAELFARLRGTNNLIFTNSRKEAEAFMVALKELSEKEGVPNEFRLHHGFLSRADRHEVEKELQKGYHPATAICTASMELGIDIGKVKSIAQIGTAGSPATLRQRLGRSGRRGEPSILRVYSVDECREDYKFHLRSNLVQNVAAIELLRAKQYDRPVADQAFASILVQQLASLLSEHGSYYASEAYEQLCRRGPFSWVTESDFSALLKHLGAKGVISQLATGQLVIGKDGERLVGNRDFYSAFTTPKDYSIVDKATNRTVGVVQYKPYYGEVFILAGQHWIVDSVQERSSTVYVGATHSKGKMMFEGTGIEASAAVARKMLEIYKTDTIFPYLDPATATPQHLEAARQWFKAKGLDECDFIRDGQGLAYLTWSGMKANRAIALMANTELGINPAYDHLSVTGLSPENLSTLGGILQAEESLEDYGARLASHVPRVKKERGKFDIYLPDSLLDREYAASRLDLASAKEALIKHC